MRYIKTFEDININFDQENDPDIFKFNKGDYVRKIVPGNHPGNNINLPYIVDWLYLENKRKYYGIIFLTGEDAGIESEYNLTKLEDYELAAMKYNL